MGDHFIALTGADRSILVEEGHAADLIKCFDAHRAGIHAQCAADISWDAFHPFKAADARGRRDAGKFLEPHACTHRDLAIRADIHFGKCPAARMDHRAADPSIAHQQV